MVSTSKYRKVLREVSPAIEAFATVTGYPRWFAQNIIVWRAFKRLPVAIGRVLDA